MLASEAPTTQHSLPVPVLLSAQPREQFSFLSVGTGGTLRPLFGGHADVGPAFSLPSSAAPLLRGGLRAEALLTPGGREEGPVLPTAPAVQSWAPRWPPCPARHAEVVPTEQAKRGRCPEAGPGGRQAAQAGTALATRPARGPATGALGPKKDWGQRGALGEVATWLPALLQRGLTRLQGPSSPLRPALSQGGLAPAACTARVGGALHPPHPSWTRHHDLQARRWPGKHVLAFIAPQGTLWAAPSLTHTVFAGDRRDSDVH